MTKKEAERFRLMENHSNGLITLQEVSNLLSLSRRQTIRIWNKFRAQGAKGLISKRLMMQQGELQLLGLKNRRQRQGIFA